MSYGPTLPISQEVGQEKHYPGETYGQAARRWAEALADDAYHAVRLFNIFANQRFAPAGRVQRAAGHMDVVTAFNCFVSGEIEDSMEGILDRVKEAGVTMQKGGGIGYNFGTIRPRGSIIESLRSSASGAVSFMEPFNAVCSTVASAGNRRGAQMAVLPVWHPDIEEFIEAKTEQGKLTFFNVSVGVTDKFMMAVRADADFDLVWGGKWYKTVRARELWAKIMKATWDWAEPGVVFLDTINDMNNLRYCETISATNPCGEQPLPPFGACLLGSFNWVKYVYFPPGGGAVGRFDTEQLQQDVEDIVRAMDNVIDRTIYPLPEQALEASEKRRMGLGAMGVANTLEALGLPYGEEEAAARMENILQTVANAAYAASARLAAEKGAFPLYEAEAYLSSEFVKRLEPETVELIRKHGIRNSHLTSIAPTGSIALAADNVSSGIEPPFSLEFDRTILMADGTSRVETVTDYAYRVWGIAGRTANELAPEEHVRMLTAAQRWSDSAVSKTCNIGDDVTFDQFQNVYMQAWINGAKGCTTFRAAGRRFGILNVKKQKTLRDRIGEAWAKLKVRFARPETEPEMTFGEASCTFDPESGRKTCE